LAFTGFNSRARWHFDLPQRASICSVLPSICCRIVTSKRKNDRQRYHAGFGGTLTRSERWHHRIFICSAQQARWLPSNFGHENSRVMKGLVLMASHGLGVGRDSMGTVLFAPVHFCGSARL
jgi:hypothetical protein